MQKQFRIYPNYRIEGQAIYYTADKTQFDLRPWGVEFVEETTHSKLYIPWTEIRFIEEVNV